MTTNLDCSINAPATSRIIKNTVAKVLDNTKLHGIVCQFLFENELKYLETLQHLSFIPTLYFAQFPVIVMEDCGEPLTHENAPDNLEERLTAYISILHQHNCYHNDIKPDNILIDGDKITIIDFGWSTPTADIPPEFPDVLGGDFRGDNGIDDFESLKKVINHLSKNY